MRAHSDPIDTRPRRSLILAGGGMRVAYQAGVLIALEEAGITFDHVDGTSGGTMNTAMLLSGQQARNIAARWRSLNVVDFASLLTLREYFQSAGPAAFGSADGVRERVFPALGIDVQKIKRATHLQGSFNLCNYSDKICESIPHTEIALPHLVAGVSLPMFMPIVPHNGKLWTDAVWIKDSNIQEALRRGAEEIWLVWCIGNISEYHPGILEQYVHMIEIAANAALFDEFEAVHRLNRTIEAGEPSPWGQRQSVRIHIVKPEIALPLDPAFMSGEIDADTLISMGYSDAQRTLHAFERGHEATLDFHSTKMKSAAPGLAWRSHFDGTWENSTGDAPFSVSERFELHFAFELDVDQNVNSTQPLHGRIFGSIVVPNAPESLRQQPLVGGRLELHGNMEDPNAQNAAVTCIGEGYLKWSGVWYGWRFEQAIREKSMKSVADALKSASFELTPLGKTFDINAEPLRFGNVIRAKLRLRCDLVTLVKSLRTRGNQGISEGSAIVARFVRRWGGPVLGAAFKRRTPCWKFWS